MDLLDHFTGRRLLYNGSMVVVWLAISVEIGRLWPRLTRAMRGAIGTWWALGLALVWARFEAGLPASGHAIWMWPMLVLAFRLGLSTGARGAALAMVALVFAFKAHSGNLPSVAYGSAIGIPVAALLARIDPFQRD